MKTIDELRDERLRARISQGNVARLMGTTQSALSRAEREGNPTQDFLQRYERALDDLIAETAQSPVHPEISPGGHESALEITTLKLIIAKIAAQYGISEMYVFGSVARGEARPDSDVDLLYRFKPGIPYSATTLQNLTDDLESMLGRKVSLTSYATVLRNAQRSRASKRFLDHISLDMIKVA